MEHVRDTAKCPVWSYERVTPLVPGGWPYAIRNPAGTAERAEAVLDWVLRDRDRVGRKRCCVRVRPAPRRDWQVAAPGGEGRAVTVGEPVEPRGADRVRARGSRFGAAGRGTGFERHVVPEILVLLGVAATLTSRAADAEDLVQGTLIRAHRAVDRFDGEHPRAWLLTILRNTRRCAARRRLPELLRGPDARLGHLRIAGAGASAEQVALEARFDADVCRGRAGLSGRLRVVVVLVDVVGLSYSEAAAVWGLARGDGDQPPASGAVAACPARERGRARAAVELGVIFGEQFWDRLRRHRAPGEVAACRGVLEVLVVVSGRGAGGGRRGPRRGAAGCVPVLRRAGPGVLARRGITGGSGLADRPGPRAAGAPVRRAVPAGREHREAHGGR